MAPPTTKKADIVQAYLARHTSMSDREAGRKIFSRHPTLWSTEDACYQAVRYYRKHQGNQGRKNREGKSEYPRITAGIQPNKPTIKLMNKGRWAIFGDLHVPYHDERAVEAAVRYAIDRKSDHLLINGDALDAYLCSRWEKDPGKRHVDQELETLKEILHEIAVHFPGRKVYKIGNHEARIAAYFLANAPNMIGASNFDLCKTLAGALDLQGWDWIDSKQLFTLGILPGYHGHELPKGLTNPVSVGRGVWLRTNQSGFTNHWHRSSEHIESNADKSKIWSCYSLGCLCHMHPEYALINNWNHGSGECDIGERGHFNFASLRIHDGEVWG